MKKLIALIIAAAASVSTLQAHCGTCSLSEGADAACCQGTLASYFSIQKALAGDDLATAKATAADLDEALGKSQCPIDGGECCAKVSTAAHSIAEAADIAAARTSFLALSTQLIAQIESLPGESAVYQMHCPMAFKGKGGSWLQDSANIKNPYYGASMLTCGFQEASYGTQSSAADHDAAGHSGHTH